jgi:hypothetical protein
MVKQVARIGGEVLSSTDLQSFYNTDVQFWMLVFKLIPPKIPMHPISKWGGSSLSNFCKLSFELL